MRKDRPCRCGSGQMRYQLLDAAGIFCAFVCSSCEETKRKSYNPAIFTSGTSYAASGEELDIGLEADAEGERESALLAGEIVTDEELRSLIGDAAKAVERFGEDELERWAAANATLRPPDGK